MPRLALYLVMATFTILSGHASSPQITTHPETGVVAVGKSAFIDCQVAGHPVPTVEWKKGDDVAISDGDKYVVHAHNNTLEITSFTSTDDDQYYCLATNTDGTVRSLSAHLTAATLGTVTETSSNVEFTENTVLTLSCNTPTSTPPATVTWYRGDSIASLDTRVGVTFSHELVLRYTTNSDQAPWKCVVSNPLVTSDTYQSNQYFLMSNGTTSSSPPIQLLENALPVSQTKVAGETAKFQCFTTGRSTPSYVWKKDGTTLVSSDRVSFEQSDRIITVSNLSLTDAGNYTCEVTDNNNEVVALITATLSVLDPPKVAVSFNATSQYASESISLSCSAEGTPPISWTWRHDGAELAQSDSVSYNETGLQSTLVLQELAVGDRGVYQCIAHNENTGSGAASNLLTIDTVLPYITEPPHDVLVFTGGTIVLPCRAVSYPHPIFRWTKNSASFAFTDRHTQVSETFEGTLTISSAMMSDDGTYNCVVDSDGNLKISSDILVDVIDSPDVLNSPVTQLVIVGDTVYLECSVEDTALITETYIWSRDGDMITTHANVMVFDNGTLRVSNFSSDNDAGEYGCMVELDPESTQAEPLLMNIGTAFLTTVEPTTPSSPSHLQVISLLDNSVSLQWTQPEDNGGLQILRYVVVVRELDSVADCTLDEPAVISQSVTTETALVSDLRPFRRYNATIYAVNSKGNGNSLSMTFTTRESAPSSPPSISSFSQGLQVGELIVTWTHPECLDRNGIITHYSISYLSNDVNVTIATESNHTSYTITDLRLFQSYSVEVAAHTRVGVGPKSSPLTAETTLGRAPEPPESFTASILNSSIVRLSWTHPPLTQPLNSFTTVTNYTITHERMTITVNNRTTMWDFENLTQGSIAKFSIAATNSFGTSRRVFTNVTLPASPTETDPSSAAFYDETWFVPSAGGVGVAVLVIAVLCVVFCGVIGCVRCKRRKMQCDSTTLNRPSEFAFPKRKSTVLDRMMSVEPMAPGTKVAEYADLDTLQKEVQIPSNSGTLTSQNSTLRSKYQFLTLLEREELEKELRKQKQELPPHRQQTDSLPQPEPQPSQPQFQSSKKHTSRKKPNNLNFYNPTSIPPQSSSPTDTVSSFEYQSQAQMLAMLTTTPAELTIRRPSGGRRGPDQIDAGYESSQDESDIALSRQSSTSSKSTSRQSHHHHHHHGHRRNLSGGSNRSKSSSFKRSQLPDLALMTALPPKGSPSPSSMSHTLSSPSPSSMMQLPTAGQTASPMHHGMAPYHTSMQLYPMQHQGHTFQEMPPEIPKKKRHLSPITQFSPSHQHSTKDSLHNVSIESSTYV